MAKNTRMKDSSRCERLAWVGLFAVSTLTLACGAAPPSTSRAAVPPSPPATAAAENSDPGGSLGALRAKLSAGARVSELSLAAKGFGPGLVSVLSAAPSLSALTSLDVSDNDLGVEGARSLARSLHLDAVRELDLGGNDIGDEGAQAIARGRLGWPGYAQLERQFAHECRRPGRDSRGAPEAWVRSI